MKSLNCCAVLFTNPLETSISFNWNKGILFIYILTLILHIISFRIFKLSSFFSTMYTTMDTAFQTFKKSELYKSIIDAAVAKNISSVESLVNGFEGVSEEDINAFEQ